MADTPSHFAEPAREWIAQRVGTGAWPDADAYLNDLVARDRDDAERLAYVRAAIAEAKAGGISDRSVDDVIAEGQARHISG